MPTENKYYDLLKLHYDYCYLESMHHFVSKPINSPYKHLILGLSYGLDDIELDCFNTSTVNMACHSQDLYYDLMHIYNVLQSNSTSFTDCIFILGYYSFFYDVSMGNTRDRCISIYGPLLNNLHHASDPTCLIPKIESMVGDIIFKEWYHSFFKAFPA